LHKYGGSEMRAYFTVDFDDRLVMACDRRKSPGIVAMTPLHDRWARGVATCVAPCDGSPCMAAVHGGDHQKASHKTA
jgi:hypothetical protein